MQKDSDATLVADAEPDVFFDALPPLDSEPGQERPLRVCPEPVGIGVSLAATGLILAGGIDDPMQAAHPFGGLCKVCEAPLDTLWRQIDAKLAPGFFPVNCCDKCYEDAKVDHDRLRHNREMWERVCPTEFRKDWDPKLGDQKLFDRAMKWAGEWNASEGRKPRRGLVIHGDSGTAKTRVAWQLNKRLCEEGIGSLFVDAYDLIEEMPKEAFQTDCLIVDDLGNDIMDRKKEQRFLKLLRVRAQWHRPVVVTTQYVGDAMIRRFGQQGAGDAVVRRLREFCDAIHAKPI